MYKNLSPGEEKVLFDPKIEYYFFQYIQEDILKYLKKVKNVKKVIVGAMALHDVPLLDGQKTKIWLEYNGRLLPIGIDCGITKLIIFDEIPDEVLDRYNLIRAKIYQSTGK